MALGTAGFDLRGEFLVYKETVDSTQFLQFDQIRDARVDRLRPTLMLHYAAHRAALACNARHQKELEPELVKKSHKRPHGVIALVLVIDRVEEKIIEYIDDVIDFELEDERNPERVG